MAFLLVKPCLVPRLCAVSSDYCVVNIHSCTDASDRPGGGGLPRPPRLRTGSRSQEPPLLLITMNIYHADEASKCGLSDVGPRSSLMVMHLHASMRRRRTCFGMGHAPRGPAARPRPRGHPPTPSGAPRRPSRLQAQRALVARRFHGDNAEALFLSLVSLASNHIAVCCPGCAW